MPASAEGRGNLNLVSWFSMDDVEAAIISSRDNSCSGVARGAAKKASSIQWPLDIATLDKAAALPIATSTLVTNLRQYINSDLGYNDLKFQLLCSRIATVNSFEVAISNSLSLDRLHVTFFNQMSFGNSDRAVDFMPLDGGQSLYPMSTVFGI